MKFNCSTDLLNEISNRNTRDINRVCESVYEVVTQDMVSKRIITTNFHCDLVDTWIDNYVSKTVTFDRGSVYIGIMNFFETRGFVCQYIDKQKTFEVSIDSKIIIEFAKSSDL